MKKGIFISVLLFISFNIFAQTPQIPKGRFKITGKVIDSSSGKPLEYATISLFTLGNTKPINGTTTNTAGRFEVSDVAEGAYSVVIEFIGYYSHTIKDVSVNQKNSITDLKSISLSKKSKTLQAVVITSQGKLIENKIDKMVFNAERDLTSQGGVATDVLKKVPQVSVDIDGNVQLSGSSSIRFLINGKPSSSFGSNIADVLQSIPASQIKSVEVITNPGAKYDAQGLGGIINIILKTNTAQGINGNISLSAGTRMENGSFNFNARKNKLGFNAFISGNKRLKAKTPSVYDRNSTNDSANTITLLHQDGYNNFIRHGIQSGVGFDWSPDERNNFSGSINYNNFGNTGSGIINQSQITYEQPGGNMLAQLFSINHTDNKFNFHNIEGSLNYKKTFSREGQELEFSANTSNGNNLGIGDNYQVLASNDSLIFGTHSRNPGKEKETEIQLDYTQPLNKDVTLGLGTKMTARDITTTSNVLSLETAFNKYFPDPFLSNSLNYHEKVYAFYSEINFPVFKLFDAKIGGRYERTDISSYFSSAQNQASIPGYNTFVPSVFFIKKITEKQSIKINYSKRIERPDYRDLNPYINTSDPKNFSSGNPYLKPEIGNRYELGYSADLGKGGSFMATIFYRTSNQDIQPYIVYYPSLVVGDTTYTNVSVSTAQNIGLEKNVGVNLFSDLHVINKLSFRTNLFFFRRHTINTLDPGFNSNSFNYRVNANATYQFSNTLAGEFFGNFNSARHEVQGRYPSFTSYSMGLRKQFWNKKASIALTASNPFNEYIKQQTYVFGKNFTTTSIRKVPFRSFGINFTWKFGKLEFKKPKPENNESLNPPAE